jgi:hypothetical protein
MKSVLDVMVSCFRNYYTPGNPVNINLLDWLLSKKYLPQIDQIRMMTEKADRDRHKANIPAITPSGTFSHKEAKGLIQHSGLIQFDIDLTKGNLEIENWSELKSEIFNFRNVAYIGLSASGMGLWGLIPISNPEQHKAHFKAIEKAFFKWGIELDPAPQNVSSLRGYSYDPEALYRHDAEVFTAMVFDDAKGPIKTNTCRTPDRDNRYCTGIENYLRMQIRNAADGEKWFRLRSAAYWAGGLVAGGQVEEDWAIDLLTEEIQAKPHVNDFKKACKTIKDCIQSGKMKPIYPKPSFDRYTPTATATPTRQKTADAPKPKAAPPQVEKAAAAPAEPPQPPTATAEDITFSRMAEKCPKLKQFAERLDLISTATGKPFQIIPIEQPTQPEDIAPRILQPRNSYTAVEIAHMMEKALKMPPDTAATGVKKLISAGAIEHSGNQRYHLKDSTPF